MPIMITNSIRQGFVCLLMAFITSKALLGRWSLFRWVQCFDMDASLLSLSFVAISPMMMPRE